MIKRLLTAVGIGTGIGALAALGVYLLGRATGEEFIVTSPGAAEAAPLAWFLFIVATAVQGGVGGFVLAVLATLTPWPRRAFVVVTTVLLLVSFATPFSAAESTGAAIWLSLAHVAAFAGIVPVVAGALPTARRPKDGSPVASTTSGDADQSRGSAATP